MQLEVLMELERETGQKVSQLFDWIIGTSAGSLIATGNAVGKISTCASCGVSA